jgi:N-glycosidase YbiA
MTPATITLDNGAAIPAHHYSRSPEEALFFYGGWASNFVGGPFYIESPQPWITGSYGNEYETVEHFYQASKAISLRDHQAIAAERGPWQAKRAGRKTRLRNDWEDVKFDVMLTGLRHKFGVAASMTVPLTLEEIGFRDTLLATGNRYIAEDSPTDYEWGIRDHRGGYTGNNLLGKALMQIRDERRTKELR